MPFAENLGTGGGSLDAQYGSSPTANTNAPLLLDPRTSGNFVYTPGTAGNYVAVPHSDSLNILGTEGTPFFAVQGSSASQCRIASDSNLNVTGDLEVVLRFSADNWVLPLNIFISRGVNPLFCWRVGLTGAGNLFIDASPNGLFASRVSAVSTVPVPFVNNVVYWVRIRFDVNNGAGGNTTTFEWAADSPSEPTSWTAIGSPVTNAGTTSIFATTDVTAFLQVGCESGSIFGGRFYRAIVRNGFAGPAVADINFTQQALGVRGFIESTGKLVTLSSANGRIVDGTTYGFLPGVIGSNWSAPDSAALDIAGDIDIKVWLSMNDWTPAAFSTPVGKWNGATPSYYFRINTNGTLTFVWVDSGGTTQQLTSTVSVGLADGSSKWIRGTLDVNNGAGQAAAKFYTSDDGTTWTQLGTTVTGTFGTSSIRVGTASLSIGLRDGDQVVSGRVFRVIIQSAFDTADNVASKVFDADFTRQLQFVSAFVEDQNLAVVTAQGTARIERDRDLDLRVRVALDDWTPTTQNLLISKSLGAATDYSWSLEVSPTSTLVLRYGPTPTSRVDRGSTAPLVAVDGQPLWLRVTVDVNNGANGNTVTFFQAPDSDTMPTTWTTLGTPVVTAGTTGLAPTTQPVLIGGENFSIAANASGKFYAVQVLNGINGSPVLDIDFTDAITTGAETYLPDTPSEVIPEALQYLPNLGWGGTALNARFGSAVGADTNDPLLLTHTGENYWYRPSGSVSNNCSVPNLAAYNPTTTFSITARIAFTDWTPSATQDIAQRTAFADPNRQWGLLLLSSGALRLQIIPTGSAASIISIDSAVVPVPDGESRWLRVSLNGNDGAGNRITTFEMAADQATEPSSWSLISQVTTAGTISFTPVTSAVLFGSAIDTDAKFYRVIYRVAGTVQIDANFTTGITSGAQTTFTESSPNAATVTISRNLSGRKSVAVVQDVLLFGTDDYLEVPDSDLLDFGASDSFTVMAAARRWTTFAANSMLVAKKSSTNAVAAGWQLVSGGASDYVQVADGTGQNFDTETAAASGALTTVVGVRDKGASTLRAFVGAVSAGTSVDGTGNLANGVELRVGRLSASGTNYADMEWRGSAVWRRALSATEVALVNTHYTTGPTTASTALMQQAVWWIDAGTRSVAQINRSTSGRKSVACARCVWLLGTDDYFEVTDSPLWDFAQGQDYTLLVLHRGWWAQGTNDTLLATQSSTTASAAGWAMSNSSGDPWQAGGRHGDGSIGVTAVAPRRDVGTLTGTFLVRDTLLDTLTAFTGSTSGTPVTDTTTGTIGNTNVMRLGRLSTTGTEYLDAEVVAAVVWRRKLTAAERAAVLAYYGV